MNMTRKRNDTIRTVITSGVSQPRETPSDKAMRRRSSPEVKKNAPIQSTLEARGWSAVSFFLEGSFGITNIDVTPVMKAAPAITKKTTFQLVHSEISPP
jgi:hypothetical protein